MTFIDTHSHRNDPQTSRDAAGKAATKVGRHCDLILQAMIGPLHGLPAIAEEIAKWTEGVGIDRYEVSRRLPDMESKGLVRKTGETATNAKGNACALWEPVK